MTLMSLILYININQSVNLPTVHELLTDLMYYLLNKCCDIKKMVCSKFSTQKRNSRQHFSKFRQIIVPDI